VNDLTFESSQSMDTSVVCGTGSECVVNKHDAVQISCNSVSNFGDLDQKMFSIDTEASECENDYQVCNCILMFTLNVV
jgi:hypothetical protein